MPYSFPPITRFAGVKDALVPLAGALWERLVDDAARNRWVLPGGPVGFDKGLVWLVKSWGCPLSCSRGHPVRVR